MSIEIRYEINNEVLDENTEKAMIAFLEKDINFSGAHENCEKMKATFREKGYSDDEIQTWIEISGRMEKYSQYYPEETVIRSSCYSYAKTPHTHTSMSEFNSVALFLLKPERTKELNTLGQTVIEAYRTAKTRYAEKLATEQKTYDAIIDNIVSETRFCHKGKEYTVSEEIPEKETETEEE